jgi:glucose-6-phosphate isomerase
MSFVQSLSGCLETNIGSMGLSHTELQRWLEKLAPGFAALKDQARNRSLPLFRILYEEDDLVAAQQALDRLSVGADTLIFFGTGGSSLGGQALAQLSGWSAPGGEDMRRSGRLDVRLHDNLDSRSLKKELEVLDLERTRFVAVSKSGNTAETLMQVLTVIERLKAAGLGDRVGKMFLGVTEPAKTGVANGLRSLLEHFNVPILPHDTGIGGRYSAFSNVGMLPALACGLDARALRAGARAVVDGLAAAAKPEDCPPALGAALTVGLNVEKDIRALVMMPYTDRLQRFALWYAQLWGESLGKSGKGTTPVAALGPVDQHSQLQLYLDGTPQHLVTLVRVAPVLGDEGGPVIDPELARIANAPYLANRRCAQLVDAEQRALADALVEYRRPVRIFDADALDEECLGGLMMHFIVETILAGALYEVDPFDQPAVELGKKLTREYLARA